MAGGGLSEVVEIKVDHLKPGRPRVRRRRLAGLRRAAGQASSKLPRPEADHPSAAASTASPASRPISACWSAASPRPAKRSSCRPPRARWARSSARSRRSRAAARGRHQAGGADRRGRWLTAVEARVRRRGRLQELEFEGAQLRAVPRGIDVFFRQHRRRRLRGLPVRA